MIFDIPTFNALLHTYMLQNVHRFWEHRKIFRKLGKTLRNFGILCEILKKWEPNNTSSPPPPTESKKILVSISDFLFSGSQVRICVGTVSQRGNGAPGGNTMYLFFLVPYFSWWETGFSGEQRLQEELSLLPLTSVQAVANTTKAGNGRERRMENSSLFKRIQRDR